MGKLGSSPLAGLAALGLGGLAAPANTGGLNPAGKCSSLDSIFITSPNSSPVERVTSISSNV